MRDLLPFYRRVQRRQVFFGIALLGLVVAVVSARSERSSVGLVSGNAALEHIRFLSSDALGGRGNGSEGLDEAADYIAARFEELGLRPAGDDAGYFQPFEVSLGSSLGPNNFLRFEDSSGEMDLRLHRDFEPMTFSGAGDVEATPVVFVGYGITAPEHEYDDYAGVDVEGKAALVMRHTPRENGDGPFDPSRGHATFVSKVVNAKAHGAAAVLIVTDPVHHPGDPKGLVKFGKDLGADDLVIPVVHLKQAVVERLLPEGVAKLSVLQENIDKNLEPASFELTDVQVRLRTDLERERRFVKNVLGYLPAGASSSSASPSNPSGPSDPSGPSGNDELLVIGAHYDHLGRDGKHSAAPGKGENRIHNGADDNASGTAGVLELARVLAGERGDLNRGVLFAAFAGEELGLLGSRYYTRHPTFPLERTVAMLNLDMIGRLREGKLFVGGVGTSPIFQSKLEELAVDEDLALTFSFSGYGSSDHTSFTMEGVPSLFFFTGLHRDYHKPSDDWEQINASGAERVLKLAYQMADYVQALPDRPAFVKPAQPQRHQGGGGGYGAYFGSVPDFGHDGKGVRFYDIRDGGPANKAGLKAGDVLVYFNGRAIDSLHDFTDALRRHKPGDDVPVVVMRDGNSVEFRVRLAERP